MITQPNARLGMFESKILVSLQSITDDVLIQRCTSEGNSILSTLFVKSMSPGATLEVLYYDTGVGEEDGEEYFLAEHTTPDALGSDRILVTRMHNKPVLKATVTGTVEFGVYITVVASFASDIDSTLVSNEQIVDLAVDKALQVSVYDPVAGKFYFTQGTLGVQNVSISDQKGTQTWYADDVDTTSVAIPAVASGDLIAAEVRCTKANAAGVSLYYSIDNVVFHTLSRGECSSFKCRNTDQIFVKGSTTGVLYEVKLSYT